MDFIKIIKECSKNGVKSFKITEKGEVEILFQDNLSESKPDSPVETKPVFHPALLDEDQKPLVIDEKFEEGTKQEHLDDEFETLLLEDPELYEDLLMNDKLEDYGEPDVEQ